MGYIFVDFWDKVSKISTIFSADMLYKLSFPFSEIAPVETDLFFCTTSQLHLIELNVFITFV